MYHAKWRHLSSKQTNGLTLMGLKEYNASQYNKEYNVVCFLYSEVYFNVRRKS